jgi:hypothetical protein
MLLKTTRAASSTQLRGLLHRKLAPASRRTIPRQSPLAESNSWLSPSGQRLPALAEDYRWCARVVSRHVQNERLCPDKITPKLTFLVDCAGEPLSCGHFAAGYSFRPLIRCLRLLLFKILIALGGRHLTQSWPENRILLGGLDSFANLCEKRSVDRKTSWGQCDRMKPRNFHESYAGGEIKSPSERSTGLVFGAVAVIVAVLWRDRPSYHSWHSVWLSG